MIKKNEIEKDDLFVHDKNFIRSAIWWKQSRYMYVKDVFFETNSVLLANEKNEEKTLNLSFLQSLIDEQTIHIVEKDSDKAKVFLSMIS